MSEASDEFKGKPQKTQAEKHKKCAQVLCIKQLPSVVLCGMGYNAEQAQLTVS